MSAPSRCRVDIDVRYAETDQMGVVHHANYLVWFELARTELCREAGLHYAEIEDNGYYLVVTEASARYRRGSRYGDSVSVVCWIEKLESRGLRFAYEVLRGDERLATGHTHHIWVRRSDNRPCRLPEIARETFQQLAGESP
jgi:acyl-CoA thioester hydrolase